ncbi:GNAT family N-acetyltransferase [Nocardia farcinica]
MRIETTADATAFRAAAGPLLAEDPLRHTVIGTAAAAGAAPGRPGPLFLTVRADDGTAVGVAMHTPGYHAYLGVMPSAAIGPVAEAVLAAVPDNDGVEGAAEDALAFARHWVGVRGGGYRLERRLRLYRLGAPRRPVGVPGAPRRAGPADVALCAEWLAAFRTEVGMSGPLPDRAELAARIGSGRWWLWEHDGERVALVAHQAPTDGWSRIAPVYTPPHARGHGYAAALTAHVSVLLAERGSGVCLFTDLDDPVPNRIYPRVGYLPVRDFATYVFD